MTKKTFKPKKLNTAADRLNSRFGEVKLNDFRDFSIKIPGNINSEVSEDKNGFLFDSNSGRVYALNRTASFIFSKLKEEKTLSEIVKQLINRFAVEESIAMSDIQDFLYQLKEFSVGLEE